MQKPELNILGLVRQKVSIIVGCFCEFYHYRLVQEKNMVTK